MLPRHLLVLFNIYLRIYYNNYNIILLKMRIIHESDVSIKLLEYQSK